MRKKITLFFPVEFHFIFLSNRYANRYGISHRGMKFAVLRIQAAGTKHKKTMVNRVSHVLLISYVEQRQVVQFIKTTPREPKAKTKLENYTQPNIEKRTNYQCNKADLVSTRSPVM